MEYRIALTHPPDTDAIRSAVATLDAAAIVDIDPSGMWLRVAGALSVAELHVLLRWAGHPVSKDRIEQLPSVCCGSCSG